MSIVNKNLWTQLNLKYQIVKKYLIAICAIFEKQTKHAHSEQIHVFLFQRSAIDQLICHLI